MRIILTIAVLLFLGLMGYLWLGAPASSASNIGVTFIGLTNNSAKLLPVPDKYLAVFAVTNRADSEINDEHFYYLEMSGWYHTYSPLVAGGKIGPHGRGIIMTRIPTNGVPWRVVVPYRRKAVVNEIADGGRQIVDTALKRPRFNLELHGPGAAVSDWVKP